MKQFLCCLLICAPLGLSQTVKAADDDVSTDLQQASADMVIDIAAALEVIPVDECLAFIRACRQEAAASCGSAGVKSVRAICDTGECSWECNVQIEPQN